jgi:hypothetical protein
MWDHLAVSLSGSPRDLASGGWIGASLSFY